MFLIFQSGDFTRGSIRGLKEAARSGASMRGDHPDNYVAGDFTAGVVGSASQYASDNKSKLTSAGASSIGSMVGLAVAGKDMF